MEISTFVLLHDRLWDSFACAGQLRALEPKDFWASELKHQQQSVVHFGENKTCWSQQMKKVLVPPVCLFVDRCNEVDTVCLTYLDVGLMAAKRKALSQNTLNSSTHKVSTQSLPKSCALAGVGFSRAIFWAKKCPSLRDGEVVSLGFATLRLKNHQLWWCAAGCCKSGSHDTNWSKFMINIDQKFTLKSSCHEQKSQHQNRCLKWRSVLFQN